MPGSRPGTERWLVCLANRGYDLHAHLRGIRAGADEPSRRQRLANLEQAATVDLQAIAQVVQQQGGSVERTYWAVSAMAVEIPTGAERVLRAHPRIRRMVPVTRRADTSITPTVLEDIAEPPMPQTVANDSNNHCIQAARTIIQQAMLTDPSIEAGADRGKGVRVVVMDTGIDQDAGGLTGAAGPHDAFRDAVNPALSRVDAFLRAGPAAFPDPFLYPVAPGFGIDCNNIVVAPAIGGGLTGGVGSNGTQTGYRACVHSTSAFHGTAVASVITGSAFAGSGFSHPDGHAPLARLVSQSITVVPDTILRDRDRWTTDSVTILDAVQQLRSWILAMGNQVHVINVSFDGWSDPADPICIAFDDLALDHDTLIVTTAGNSPDDTRNSYGFYNAISVGSVHARATATEAFVAAGYTARGPLATDTTRFFPDVCAVGSGTGQLSPGQGPRHRYPFDRTTALNRPSYLQFPRIDTRDTCSMMRASCSLPGLTYGSACLASNAAPFGLPIADNVHLAQGTSEAAPQVSGAAALYRAVRPSATALETRAAILLNVVSPYPGAYGPPNGTGQDQDTYNNRNTYGVGFVRDDLVAEFACRTPAVAVSAEVLLDGAGDEDVITLPPLVDGQRYVAVCCWPRRTSIEGEIPVDIDLEVLRGVGASSTVVARSSSRGNTYERAGFVAAGSAGSTFKVRVFATPGSKVPQQLPTHVVFRHFDPDMDPGSPTHDVAPMHAASGGVDRLDAAAPGLCEAPAPTQFLQDVVPNVYASAWGSGPLARTIIPNAGCDLALPTLGVGFDLINPAQISVGGVPIGYSIHMEFANGVVSGPQTFEGIAFRMWRSFRCTGAATVQRIMVKQTSAPSAVTDTSLTQTSANGTIVRSSPFALAAPPTAGGLADIVSPGFDDFMVEVPFETQFAYSGQGNLHIWIEVTGTADFEVDYAGDGGPCVFPDDRYGTQLGSSIGGSTRVVGVVPIVGLLGPKVTQSTRPDLRCYGEPLVGRSLLLRASGIPANAQVVLFLGPWSPGILSLGSCQGHVDIAAPTAQALFGTANGFGTAQWGATIPLSTAFLSEVMGLQVLVVSNNTMSNAVRVAIGGGL